MIDLARDYPILDRLLPLLDTPPGVEDPLEDLPLAPDGRYQTRGVTLRRLADEVAASLARTLARRDPEDLPVLVLSWGKCRVGSTALTNLFGIAGLPSYYQPVKTMARHLLLGGDPPAWDPPAAAASPFIHSKEMAGPYLPIETVFNPLAPLLAAGYPAARLHLLILDREPHAALASWLAKWPDKLPREVLLQHFALSSLQAKRMESFARGHGVARTHYVYEASRRPAEAIAALFCRLGLADRFAPAVVLDWAERGALESDRAPIHFPVEPPVYVVPGLHGAARQYAYQDRDSSGLSSAERGLLARLGLPALYAGMVEACVAELGLGAAFAAEVFATPVAP